MPSPTSDRRATERKHPWPMVRLGELGTMVRGNGIRRCETTKAGCPCLRYGEIYTSFDVILDKPRSFVPKELFDRSVKIKKGDLVFTLTGENTEEIAKALAYLGDDEIAAGGDLAVWTGHGCDSKYLAYLMYSPQLISQKAATGNGNIVVHTSIKKLQQLEIPLPPLSVQSEIVARLERELAAVEKMKKGFEVLAETAKAEFKAELKEVFEEISCGGAETRRLGEVCELIPGFAFKSIEFGDFSTKVIRIGNINPPSIDFSDGIGVNKQAYPQEKLSKYVAYEGDCLVAMTGATIGKMGVMGVGRAYVNQRVLIVRAKSWLDQKYLSALLMSASFRKFTEINADSKAAQPNISAGTIGSYEIPLPPLSAQREVVARLDGAKAKAEKLEAKAREGVAVCETMRKAILKEAFEGSIREVESYG